MCATWSGTQSMMGSGWCSGATKITWTRQRPAAPRARWALSAERALLTGWLACWRHLACCTGCACVQAGAGSMCLWGRHQCSPYCMQPAVADAPLTRPSLPLLPAPSTGPQGRLQRVGVLRAVQRLPRRAAPQRVLAQAERHAEPDGAARPPRARSAHVAEALAAGGWRGAVATELCRTVSPALRLSSPTSQPTLCLPAASATVCRLRLGVWRSLLGRRKGGGGAARAGRRPDRGAAAGAAAGQREPAGARAAGAATAAGAVCGPVRQSSIRGGSSLRCPVPPLLHPRPPHTRTHPPPHLCSSSSWTSRSRASLLVASRPCSSQTSARAPRRTSGAAWQRCVWGRRAVGERAVVGGIDRSPTV